MVGICRDALKLISCVFLTIVLNVYTLMIYLIFLVLFVVVLKGLNWDILNDYYWAVFGYIIR